MASSQSEAPPDTALDPTLSLTTVRNTFVSDSGAARLNVTVMPEEIAYPCQYQHDMKGERDMSDEKRPGGLTALAVLNFVFVGLSLLSLLTMGAFFAMIDKVPTEGMEESARQQLEALQEMGPGWLVISCVLSAVTGILLLLSGIGYLKQTKLLGRVIGSLYAVVSIIGSVVTGVMLAPEIGGGFQIGTMIGLIYPILTLILVNTTFKDDLIN